MTDRNDDQAFADAIAKKLKEQEYDVSPEVAERLTAARREAIAAMDAQTGIGARNWLAPQWLVPAGGMAAASLAVLLLWPRGPESLPVLEEAEFAAATEMDMLDEIELIAWMLEEDSNAG